MVVTNKAVIRKVSYLREMRIRHYEEKLFNFTTCEVPDCWKSHPLVHELSYKFHQSLQANKDYACNLSRSSGLMYVFNYSYILFILNSNHHYLLRGWPTQQDKNIGKVSLLCCEKALRWKVWSLECQKPGSSRIWKPQPIKKNKEIRSYRREKLKLVYFYVQMQSIEMT